MAGSFLSFDNSEGRNLTSIYLIRHAQSTGQQPDSELTELGKNQTQDMMVGLRDLRPDGAFSSLYRRVVETFRL